MEIYTYKPEEAQAAQPKARWLNRLVRAIMPRFYHQSGYPKQPWRVEYWHGDDQWKTSVHLHWNFIGKAHWLCIFLPECPNGRAEMPRPSGGQ
jgi:hypothetical protein